MSALLETLTTLDAIVKNPGISTAALMGKQGMSERSVKRHISEARTLGAQIESKKDAGKYGWHCTNADALRERLARWIAAEGPSLVDEDEDDQEDDQETEYRLTVKAAGKQRYVHKGRYDSDAQAELAAKQIAEEYAEPRGIYIERGDSVWYVSAHNR